MSDTTTTTETIDVVVHVDRTLSDRRALTLTSPDIVEIIVHPDVPIRTVNCLKDKLADAVEMQYASGLNRRMAGRSRHD
jgi:hypothetical protein